MSECRKARSAWKKTLQRQAAAQTLGPMVDQQSSDEQPQQVEPPMESQPIAPDQGKGDPGAPEVQVLGLKEVVKPKSGVEGGDGPEVVGCSLPSVEPTEMLQKGSRDPRIQRKKI